MMKVKNSRVLQTIPLLITILSLSIPANAQYSGGAGEPNEPYQIATAEDLMLLGESPEDYDKHFILTADIDMDPNLPGRKVFEKAIIGSFIGLFDGNSHTISHLTIQGEDSLGLFRRLQNGAEVKNLGIVGVNITGSGDDVGGLAGLNGGFVTGCYSTGSVSGDRNVGGLSGRSEIMGGVLIRCHSTITVSGNYAIGGLVGFNRGHLIASFSGGVITGTECVGGLAGLNKGVRYTGFKPWHYIWQPAWIVNCYSSSSVSGSIRVGGAVGSNSSTNKPEPSKIVSCYSTGKVSGNEYTGGLVGANGSQGTIGDSFWDITTSGQTTSAGGTGKITSQMQMANTYVFWSECGEELWTIDEGNNYPRLWWEEEPGEAIMPISLSDFLLGTGTMDDPYFIYTAEELNLIGLGLCDLDKHFRLMADIDLSEFDGKEGRLSFNIIGIMIANDPSHPFTGIFDGNGHTISHLTLTGTSGLGLFGQIDVGAEIRDLGIVDVNITGSGYDIGSLVGVNTNGTITNCYATGSISGDETVGGLVGNNGLGTITQSYSTCKVSGNGNIGGLVGKNIDGNITQSYSTGIVDGILNIGGLVGSNGGVIAYCYSIGLVSYTGTETEEHVGGLIGSLVSKGIEDLITNNFAFVSACFWDVETSGQTTSCGGTGKTTAEMQSEHTFMIWGTCGNEGIWTIDEGNDYPRLWWENKHGEPIISGATLSELLKGEGTEDSPYMIYTADELNLISLFWCDWDKHFKLMEDIDLSGFVYDTALIAPETYLQTRTFDGTPFTGVFDGNGHTISHLTITGICYLGLFGKLGSEAMVTNLGLEVVDVNGTSYCVGGLVGYNRGTMTQCYSTGAVTGGSRTGGLVGYNGGTMTQCDSTGIVTGGWVAGGLVGYNGGTMTQCDSSCSVSGSNYAGGLVGENEFGDMTHCYSTGAVSGTDNVGGLVGFNNGDLNQCYGTGSVSGSDSVGGLVGKNYDNINSSYSTGTVSGTSDVGGLAGVHFGFDSIITTSYSTGAVRGDSNVGGLVGINYEGVIQSYSTGLVSGNESVGGLVGSGAFDYYVIQSFWDIETSGQTTSDGGTGKTTGEMQTAGTFHEASWDFVDETENGTEDIWWIDEGKDYPRLWWEAEI